MGKKQNAYLLRTAINGWRKSVWVPRSKENCAKNILEDYQIRQYILNEVGRDKVSEVIIHRINLKVIATIMVHKMSFFTKSKEEGVITLQAKLNQHVNKKINPNVEIRIEEVNNSDIDANLIAGNIAAQITNRQNYKKAAKRAIRMAMKSGALGIRIRLSGRLGGVSIARTVLYREGTVPLQTFKVKIDQAAVQAPTSFGICGVKVLVARN